MHNHHSYDATPHTLDARPARRFRPFWPAIASLAVLLIAGGWFISIARDSLDPQARQVRAVELESRISQSERLQPLSDATVAAWMVLPVVIVAGGAFVALAAAWRRYVAHSGEYVDVAKLREIHRPGQMPASLHYSPNIKPGAPVPLLPPALDQVNPAAPQLATFAELLDQGAIAPGRGLILGLDSATGEPLRGDWKALYSAALGGLQGSGKTWTAVGLLAQSALSGARLVVCDPHAGDGESLAARVASLQAAFLCEIADDERAILEALRLADDELQRRKQGAPQRWPLVVAVDEWASLRRGRLAETLPALVEDFSTEGRKLQCHVLLMTQRADKESFGQFRNTMSSSYVHRMRPAEARMLTGLPAGVLPDDVLQLAPGESYLLDTRGNVRRVHTPRMNAGDVERVAGLLTADHPSMPNLRRRSDSEVLDGLWTDFGRQTDTPSTAPGSVTRPNTAPLDPESARIVQLFQSGLSMAQVVKELSGATSGRQAQEIRERVEAVLRGRLG